MLPYIQAVLNSPSYTTSLPPGTWAAIFGTGLAPFTAVAQAVPLQPRLAPYRLPWLASRRHCQMYRRPRSMR
jgi:hypothetical protein